MNNETQPLDYELPDWTADEMRSEPPFTFADAYTRVRRTQRQDRGFGWLIWSCIAVIVICAAGLVLL